MGRTRLPRIRSRQDVETKIPSSLDAAACETSSGPRMFGLACFGREQFGAWCWELELPCVAYGAER